jgi:hypothetical protein
MAVTIQSTYGTTANSYPVGFAGMLANGETQNRISRTIEDAAGIAFGKAAFRGSGDHGVTGTPAAATFMGIVIADAGQVPGVGETADTIAQYRTVSLLQQGVIYVSASVAVADGDQAYVTSGGAITNVSTSNTAIPAKFDATIGAAGIVALRVFSDRT